MKPKVYLLERNLTYINHTLGRCDLTFQEIIRDEHLERVRKLNSDRRPGRCSREREDVALQSRAVSRQIGL